jgi:hypothetical protein
MGIFDFLFGGDNKTTSTINNNVRFKSVVNAMSSSIMNCAGSGTAIQKFTLSGSYNNLNNFKMVQAFNFDSQCKNNVSNLADIQASVSNAIKSSADSQSQALLSLLSAGTQSNVNTIIDNDVRQNITNETITKIITDAIATQEAVISGNNNIVNNFTMDQTISIVAYGCQEVLNKMKTVQAIANETDSSASAKQENPITGIISAIGGIFTSLGSMMTIVLIIGIIVFGVVIVHMGPGALLGAIFGNSDKKEQTSEMNNYAPPVQQVQ